MKRFIGFDALRAAAIVAVVAAWPLAQVAHGGPPEPAVPSEIQVPDGNKVFLVGHAVGVQMPTATRTRQVPPKKFRTPPTTTSGRQSVAAKEV